MAPAARVTERAVLGLKWRCGSKVAQWVWDRSGCDEMGSLSSHEGACFTGFEVMVEGGGSAGSKARAGQGNRLIPGVHWRRAGTSSLEKSVSFSQRPSRRLEILFSKLLIRCHDRFCLQGDRCKQMVILQCPDHNRVVCVGLPQ